MNYTLDIVSHHPDFESKTLRKHKIEGVETVGALLDEPFEIRFTNHTWQKVQVKLSLDGIDIMTGELATTEPAQDMWIVQPNSKLSIKAWPETSDGGAALVFTHAGNSVVVHTNGDLSHRGMIAVAVYTEGHVEPLKLTPLAYPMPVYVPWYQPTYYSPWYQQAYDPITWTYTININAAGNDTYGGSLGGGTYSCSTSNAVSGDVCGTYSCNSVSVQPPTLQDQQSLPAIGAGQYVEQKIEQTAGLIKPLLAETIRVRYLWWNELEDKLINQTVASSHPSGFPADTKKRINLGSTPRIGTPNVDPPMAQPFVRVDL